MSFIELFFIAAGLSADAFAAAVADGLNITRRRKAVLIAFMFGLFQALMPLLGYALGMGFARYINAFDHYLALGVLGFIGGKMIVESVGELRSGGKPDPDTHDPRGLGFPVILAQAAATAIDALMVGVSFAAIGVKILPAAAFIGLVTFCISLAGALGGRRLGMKLGVGAGAELAGGIVLVAIGIKTFLTHILGG